MNVTMMTTITFPPSELADESVVDVAVTVMDTVGAVEEDATVVEMELMSVVDSIARINSVISVYTVSTAIKVLYAKTRGMAPGEFLRLPEIGLVQIKILK